MTSEVMESESRDVIGGEGGDLTIRRLIWDQKIHEITQLLLPRELNTIWGRYENEKEEILPPTEGKSSEREGIPDRRDYDGEGKTTTRRRTTTREGVSLD